MNDCYGSIAMTSNSMVYASLASDPGYIYLAHTTSSTSANLNGADTSVIRISGDHTLSAWGAYVTLLT